MVVIASASTSPVVTLPILAVGTLAMFTTILWIFAEVIMEEIDEMTDEIAE